MKLATPEIPLAMLAAEVVTGAGIIAGSALGMAEWWPRPCEATNRDLSPFLACGHGVRFKYD
jgi:hypothetical protein